jgi:plastocyanin
MISGKMIRKNMYTRSISSRFCLLVAVVGILVLLAACGGGSTSSTNSVTTPTTIASTPTTAASNTTPTLAPTAVQPTPTTVQLTLAKGSTLVVMIITNSDGSYSFSPAMLAIKVGTTVIWKDVSSAPHTVTSDDGTTFDSGTVPVGGSFHFTFKTAGSFSYHCNIHPYMKATIVVV